MDGDAGEGESPELGAHARAVEHVDDHHRAPDRAGAERCGLGDPLMPLPRLQHLVAFSFPSPIPLCPPIHRSSWSRIPILTCLKTAGIGSPFVLYGSSHFCWFPSRIRSSTDILSHIHEGNAFFSVLLLSSSTSPEPPPCVLSCSAWLCCMRGKRPFTS